MVSRRTVLQLVSGASATALAGCFSGGSDPEADGDGGGDGTDETDDGPGIQRTTVPLQNVGTSTAEQEYPEYEWDRIEEADPEDTDTITVTQRQEFDPIVARVAPGTTVTWESEARGLEWVIIPKLDLEESVDRNNDLEVTFEEPGVYNYLCRLHSPDHLGRIVVEETLTPDGDGSTDDGSTDDGSTDDGDE